MNLCEKWDPGWRDEWQKTSGFIVLNFWKTGNFCGEIPWKWGSFSCRNFALIYANFWGNLMKIWGNLGLIWLLQKLFFFYFPCILQSNGLWICWGGFCCCFHAIRMGSGRMRGWTGMPRPAGWGCRWGRLFFSGIFFIFGFFLIFETITTDPKFFTFLQTQ